jgi:hypothetical protein
MDFNKFLPPFQPVELPSKGKLYTNPALKDGWIQIREYCATEEALLAQINRENVQQVLNSILDNCIKGNDFKTEELTSEDAFYLLVWLRANSYGANYDVEVTCPRPDCGFGPDLYTIDLSELSIVYLEDGVQEPLEVTLPKSGLKVHINCMRRGTEVAAQKRLTTVQSWKNIKGDPTDLLKRAYSIQKVTAPDGSEETTNRLEIEQLCVNILPAADSVFLDEAIQKFHHGVDIRVQLECRGCNREVHTVVPPGPDFFRPARLSIPNKGESAPRDTNAKQIRENGQHVPEVSQPEGPSTSDATVEGSAGTGS